MSTIRWQRSRLLCLALLSAGIAGCGIPQIGFLAPPELTRVISLPPAVTFAHDPTNDVDGFLGYEIYYKFYASANAQTLAESDRSAVEQAGPQSVTAVLGQRGFHRVFASGRSSLPTIEIGPAERGLNFDVDLQFQRSTAGEPATATWNATGPQIEVLVRDQDFLGSTGSGEIGFSADDLNPGTQSDLPQPSELESSAVDMAVAIVSYGIDFETFSQVYSRPIVADQLLRIIYQ